MRPEEQRTGDCQSHTGAAAHIPAAARCCSRTCYLSRCVQQQHVEPQSPLVRTAAHQATHVSQQRRHANTRATQHQQAERPAEAAISHSLQQHDVQRSNRAEATDTGGKEVVFTLKATRLNHSGSPCVIAEHNNRHPCAHCDLLHVQRRC
jgi:hypothetical protein